MEKDDYPEEIVNLDSEFTEIKSHTWYRGGTNDYSRNSFEIEKIVDRHGKSCKGIWKGYWSEISPGIETRFKDDHHVRIHRIACPVRVLNHYSREYVSYDNWEHCSQSSRYEWTRYEG